jgi:hypothetical protein
LIVVASYNILGIKIDYLAYAMVTAIAIGCGDLIDASRKDEEE